MLPLLFLVFCVRISSLCLVFLAVLFFSERLRRGLGGVSFPFSFVSFLSVWIVLFFFFCGVGCGVRKGEEGKGEEGREGKGREGKGREGKGREIQC